uniref:MasculinizerB splice variant 1 n=1 Tax=Ephestia kuehniella TaxID=40079 RepID=A0A8H2SG89_EPHKU|nr:masculinizerB splice variant 1 [Ephestia kuehniella]QXE45296.1 masculinizerB splice variant 2 [Ephestia kuehniella]
MNSMSREDSYVNQPPPPIQGPPKQGPATPPQPPGPSPRSQQGPPMIMVNPVYQSPWYLLPPPPPPRESTPPPQNYSGPGVNNTPSTSFPTRIDTSKPPPQVKNGSIRRLPEEGTKAAQTPYHHSPSRPVPEMLPIDIDTTKPPPRLPSVKTNTEKRALPEPYVGPSKTRKIETETTTCENCLQWDLRNLEIEKKKKDKLKEKAILVLRYEEKKKELADIADTLRGLHNDSSNSEPYDLTSMDLRYVLNDPDILLQRTKKLDATDFLSSSQLPKSQTRNINDIAGSSSSKDSIRNGQGTTNGLTVSAAESPRNFSTSSAVSTQSHPPPIAPPFPASASGAPSSVVTAYSQPPPVPPQFAMGQQSYRPANNQYNQYFPGPSNFEFNPHVNNSAIPPTSVVQPYDQNMYYNMMGRPPPPFT